jgi:undecaprenyl-diphosphatase
MDWPQALLSGVVQGLTEFLPVSSSGHLVIFNALFGKGESDLSFTVFLHLATLLAVVLVFRKDVWALAKEFFAVVRDLLRGKPGFKTPRRRFLLMVTVGTLPAVFAGAGVKLLGLDALLENIFVAAAMLLVTAVLMFLTDKLPRGMRTEKDAPYSAALLVGCLQAAAILPGLSRSGSTLFGGVLGGLKKEFAVKFAFILSIPAILGAGLLECLQAARTGGFAANPAHLLVGFAAAAVCGVLSIKFIRLLVRKNCFYIFGIYCLLVSAAAFLVGFGVL